MSNIKISFCICLLFITACSKKQFSPVDDAVIKPVDKCNCDLASPEYIKALFNNTSICFNTVSNITDTFNNAYYTDSSIHLDHINLIRENIDKTMSCQLHFINPDLHNKQLPYTLPHNNLAYNEYAEIVLSDLNKLWVSDVDEDYIGSTYKGFSITITDTSGGYLKGTFSGEADTKHGKKLAIDNGIFYVHTINVHKN